MKVQKKAAHSTPSIDHELFYDKSLDPSDFNIPNERVLNQMNELFEQSNWLVRIGPDYDQSNRVIVQGDRLATVGTYHPLEPGEKPTTASLYEAKEQLTRARIIQSN